MRQIGEVKAKIQAEKSWDVAQQKLIYSGKLYWLTPQKFSRRGLVLPTQPCRLLT